jgi:hypothetical protein
MLASAAGTRAKKTETQRRSHGDAGRERRAPRRRRRGGRAEAAQLEVLLQIDEAGGTHEAATS